MLTSRHGEAQKGDKREVVAFFQTAKWAAAKAGLKVFGGRERRIKETHRHCCSVGKVTMTSSPIQRHLMCLVRCFLRPPGVVIITIVALSDPRCGR